MEPQVPTVALSRKLFTALNSTDRLLVAFWFVLASLSLLMRSRISFWHTIVLADLLAVTLVFALARVSLDANSRLLRHAHEWAAFPLVIFTYKQLYFIIPPIHDNQDYDQLLIAVDRWLLRVNPTQWLAQFSTPLLTEILQIAYSLFFVLLLASGFELYCRGRAGEFQNFRFTVVYGKSVSYVGYFFLPAVGPRFTLHDFSNINSELPGLLFTPVLRRFIDFCESIPTGVSDAVAQASAQRDVFPSGHTMLTLVVMVMAFKYRLRIRHWVIWVGGLLILGTVYLRYHYVIDIIAGALLAIPCLLTSNLMQQVLGPRTTVNLEP